MRTSDQSIEVDSPYSWMRLAASLAVSTVGGIGLWSVVVILPAIEAEFGIGRGEASIPYTSTMVGLAAGGLIIGRLSDRFGIFLPLIGASVALGAGYIAAAHAPSLILFDLVQAGMIGMFGSSIAFGPLVADITHWFEKRRGLAVAVVASGNYLSGTVWPPIIGWGVATYGWRDTYSGIGIVCVVLLLPLAFLLRRRPDFEARAKAGARPPHPMPFGASPRAAQLLLVLAGLACCIAMSMPQVHIVAYCGDLGYGVARGTEMLSIMLALGIVSRLASGFIADRIGGLGTLLLGSGLQCLALLFYIPFDGLTSLYVVSAIFGLSQGGIVPSYALVVRKFFPAHEAGTRVSMVLTSTVIGMALGGWMSGEIFDLTGSYRAAFLNGIGWNVLNMSIAFWFLIGSRRHVPTAA